VGVIEKLSRDTSNLRGELNAALEEVSEQRKRLEEQQAEAAAKQKVRTETFGELYRSKGFIWMVNTHDLMGVYGQAGNAVTIETPGKWDVLNEKAWKGTEKEKTDLRKNVEEPYGDRRQELVLIGKDLKHEAIQETLDSCLLTDEEFSMGIDGWKATFGDYVLDNMGGSGHYHGEEEEDDESAPAQSRESSFAENGCLGLGQAQAQEQVERALSMVRSSRMILPA